MPTASREVNTNPNTLCSRIAEIKHLSRPGNPADDVAHQALVEAGSSVFPCLIDKLSDTTPMKDPRGIPGPTDTKVGDVAYFVLVRMADISFVELLPKDVQKEYETEGVYAYHSYVSKRKNRLQLQANLREWYKKNYPKQP